MKYGILALVAFVPFSAHAAVPAVVMARLSALAPLVIQICVLVLVIKARMYIFDLLNLLFGYEYRLVSRETRQNRT